MKYANKEALLEALRLNKNASAGYDEYPEEDMESITFHKSEEEEITKEFDTTVDYEGVLE